MKNSALFLVGFLVTTISVSCDSSLGPQRYVNWFRNPENGMLKSFEGDGYSLTVQAETPELYALMSNVSDARNQNNNAWFFEIRIADTFGSSVSGSTFYQKDATRISGPYLDFGFRESLKLMAKGEEVPCQIFARIPGTEISGYHTVIAGFNLPGKKGDSDLILKMDVLGNGIPIQIEFSKEDLIQIPKLNA